MQSGAGAVACVVDRPNSSLIRHLWALLWCRTFNPFRPGFQGPLALPKWHVATCAPPWWAQGAGCSCVAAGGGGDLQTPRGQQLGVTW
jgi:hypothetical protein